MVHQEVTDRILSAAITVHTALGAGLLESTYQACLHYHFALDGLHFEHHGIKRVVNGYGPGHEKELPSVPSVPSVVESSASKTPVKSAD